MKKIYVTCFLYFIIIQVHAQKGHTILNVHAGWGTETNIGHYGAFGGLALEKEMNKKISLSAAATYFSGNGDNLYTNDYDKYASVFLTPKIGFHAAGNQQSFFRLTLSAGPALKWYRYKWLSSRYVHVNPDGTQSLVDPVYKEESATNLSLYTGIDFSFSVSSKIKTSLFLDTYSREILLEHFMPGIKVGFQR